MPACQHPSSFDSTNQNCKYLKRLKLDSIMQFSIAQNLLQCFLGVFCCCLNYAVFLITMMIRIFIMSTMKNTMKNAHP